MITTILFDLGDTLIYGNFTAGATEAVWQEIYSRLINPTASAALPTLATLRTAWQLHVQSAMARTWREKSEHEIDFLPLVEQAFTDAGLPQAHDPSFVREVIALEHCLLYQQVVEVAPDAISTLQVLKQEGYQLGLVSNFCNLPEVAYANIKQVGLLDYFDAAILSCEIGWRKPSQVIYKTMCERLHVVPTACLFVGDRLVEDIAGPQQLGMQTAQYTRYHHDQSRTDIKPDFVITSLAELLTILKIQ